MPLRPSMCLPCSLPLPTCNVSSLLPWFTERCWGGSCLGLPMAPACNTLFIVCVWEGGGGGGGSLVHDDNGVLHVEMYKV